MRCMCLGSCNWPGNLQNGPGVAGTGGCPLRGGGRRNPHRPIKLQMVGQHVFGQPGQHRQQAASLRHSATHPEPVEGLVTVREGNLFAPVANRQFDLVICSLPKFRGQPKSTFELSWRSPDVIDRFAQGLPAAMKPGGVALVLLTSHGDEARGHRVYALR